MTKTTTITGFTASVIFMLDSDNVVNVEKGAQLMPGGDLSLLGGIGSGLFGTILENYQNPDSVHNNVYNIDGEVLGIQAGIVTAGKDDKVSIGSTGSVYGSIGVASLGTDTTIINNGKIITSFISSSSESGGILVGGTGAKVVNNGFISGYAGIIGGGGDADIVNGKNGIIYGDLAGVAAANIASSGGDIKFTNHGHVTGSSGVAFSSEGFDGNVTVINDGTLKGSIHFGGGDDTLDNRGGTLSKLAVVGGMGDDTLIVDDSKHFLQEDTGGGTDTVKSTVSYTLSPNVEDLILLGKANITGTGTDDANVIHGNSGNNKLTGLAGADNLFGGKGNDVLIGGADSDTFHFGTGDGSDTVKDFTQMADTIDVSKWTGMNSLAEIKSHAVNDDTGVVITKGDDSLTLIGVHRADLVDGDFHFAM